jgi:UDP-N-acetylmuramyl pentapeptide phosphotransferase/UDP-N-acetylglucosamine-1-phosphate transferase
MTSTLLPVAAVLAAAALCAAIIGLLLRTGLAWKVIDQPNERSLHVRPTPRIGGAVLVISAFAVWAFLPARDLWPAFALAAGLGVLSFCDDIRSLSAGVRFGGHLLAAVLALLFYPASAVWLAVVLALSFVWVVNLYNFMDGIDGLAGGMTVFGFGAFAMAAWIGGDLPLALVACALVGAAAGFLFFNFPPARIFMGDAGAIPLGFMAALLGYLGFRAGVWPGWFAPFVFSPFIVDATVTLIRRMLARERFWAAHRSHYYQRLAQSHLGHRGTTLRWYLLMASVAVTALVLREAAPSVVAGAAAVWFVIYLVFFRWIDRRWPRQPVSRAVIV